MYNKAYIQSLEIRRKKEMKYSKGKFRYVIKGSDRKTGS